MDRSHKIISSLTENSLPPSQGRMMLREFAQENGWVPSFDIDYPLTQSLANGHIVVEHGLDTTAVISFLKKNRPFMFLSPYEQVDLLGISYNNLVDWHLFPDTYGLTLVHNRVDPVAPQQVSLQEHPDVWRAQKFERISKDQRAPNLKSLDAVLVETLLFWKRALATEMERAVRNEDMSALFNGLIFVRALEDQKRWVSPNGEQVLLDCWKKLRRPKTMLKCIRKCFRVLESSMPRWLLEQEKLRSFDELSEETVLQIFGDFYKHRYIPYQYDFSLISKHALSRIYEQYVCLLRRKDSPQLTFFPDLPEEEKNKALAGFYTPQYIARFFARYLKENLTPRVFRELRTADPACGSGIFLRTILEMQCEPWQEVDMRGPTERAFSNILGIDIDENACYATRLSIALLYLVLKTQLPRKLKVVNAEAIEYFQEHSNLAGEYDAVIANPPYIAWDNMSHAMQKRVRDFMGDLTTGKTDMYLAHLRMGLDMVSPGGFLLYVLPHSFLIAKSARQLRKLVTERCYVRFLGDLSQIPVFENLGSYVILLILQKKTCESAEVPKATIVRCKEFAGRALQLGIEGRTVSEDFYEVYQVDQSLFDAEDWTLLTPKQMRLNNKMGQFPPLEHFVSVKEGFITGADDVFIRKASEVPKGEESIYVPYLSDREMRKFVVPKRSTRVVLYPYINGSRLTEDTLRKKFPQTWAYLESRSDQLKSRKSVVSRRCAWWSPVWPRPPKNLLRPKIVSPHLVLLPKFSLDEKGIYAVSRCPVLIPKQTQTDDDILYYFLGILNSSAVYWQICNLSHRYSRGYVMLEPKTLRKVRVPNPARIPSITMRRIELLVRERMKDRASERRRIETEMDRIVASLYDLSESERVQIGMES